MILPIALENGVRVISALTNSPIETPRTISCSIPENNPAKIKATNAAKSSAMVMFLTKKLERLLTWSTIPRTAGVTRIAEAAVIDFSEVISFLKFPICISGFFRSCCILLQIVKIRCTITDATISYGLFLRKTLGAVFVAIIILYFVSCFSLRCMLRSLSFLNVLILG